MTDKWTKRTFEKWQKKLKTKKCRNNFTFFISIALTLTLIIRLGASNYFKLPIIRLSINYTSSNLSSNVFFTLYSTLIGRYCPDDECLLWDPNCDQRVPPSVQIRVLELSRASFPSEWEGHRKSRKRCHQRDSQEQEKSVEIKQVKMAMKVRRWRNIYLMTVWNRSLKQLDVRQRQHSEEEVEEDDGHNQFHITNNFRPRLNKKRMAKIVNLNDSPNEDLIERHEVERRQSQRLPDWKHVRRPMTRETAFVHAITSAGIAYTLTKNCSSGDFPDCVCDAQLTRRQLGWEWGGCSDNFHFGSQVARHFLDTVEAGEDVRSMANRHNNEAGRIVSNVRGSGRSTWQLQLKFTKKISFYFISRLCVRQCGLCASATGSADRVQLKLAGDKFPSSGKSATT